ncbi:MAG: cob(I)yrinic acid a,c-diamide adenosyltransferase [Bacteroidales bacterium]|nr:cob(I)yrinic acid a,c-diamide adenosyltransferase [Bacteroidales bacterium]
MKIYTKTGDKGETNLLDNKRVSKDNIRVEAYGTVDELNAHIALIYTLIEQAECKQYLEKIENTLFLIQTHLAIGNRKDYTYPLQDITEQHITSLEQDIDNMQQKVPAFHAFVMLDAHQVCAQCHIARTICRRCERRIITLSKQAYVDNNILIYINRLSDFLFVLARYCAVLYHAEERTVDFNK